MARPKSAPVENLFERMTRDRKIWDEKHPIIRIEYCVVERTEAYNTGGYYDVDVDATEKIVSPWYASKEEAQGWADDHEPEGYKPSFKIRPRFLRHVPATERWYDY